jgi:hypothetical protein
VIATADENIEAEDDDKPSDGLKLSAKYLKSLGDSIEIETDGEPIITEASKPRKPAEATPKDARILAAESWVVEYRASRQNVKAAAASLRAYHIWHHDTDLDPEGIAKLLRTPPLQTATVVNYILEAIRLEKLPYNAIRLQGEVLSLIPKEMLASRYQVLVKACKQAVAATASEKA